MARFLVVDASPLIYSNYNSVGHLSTSTGEPTGLRFGFIRSVRSYKERMKADKVVVCWDVQGEVLKAKDQDHYKSNRVFTDEKAKMYSQVPALKQMISLTCWTQVHAEGYEADDVIGTVTRKIQSQRHETVIVTTDNDMLQLVGPGVTVFSPGGKGQLKDEEFVMGEFGVPPAILLPYRAAIGDDSDNCKGIVTASRQGMVRDWIRGCLTQEEAVAEIREKIQGMVEEMVFDNNLHVMKLWDPGESMVIKKGESNAKGLADLFTALEFKSMMKFVEELAGTTK